MVLEATGLGPVLAVAPTIALADRIAADVRCAGRSVASMPSEWARCAAGVDVVIGARSAAWAPAPGMACVVVIDGHEESLAQEQAPTWNAWIVAAERAARAQVPCIVCSPCPSLELLDWADPVLPSRSSERAGWAAIEIVDQRRLDPRAGLYSPRFVALLREGRRLLCVVNRKARARLAVCAACGEPARCERCGAAVVEETSNIENTTTTVMRCPQCGSSRPPVCLECGSTRLRRLRPGVSRIREELQALAQRPVGEVTGDSGVVPGEDALVGTEALLHRVESADAVAFLDFDQELLAPRYRAAEEALALIARASRVVDGRRRKGRILVQTRVPRHPALRSAVNADPAVLSQSEREVREALRLPPAAAVAMVSGDAAPAFLEGLSDMVEVLGPDRGRFLVRAPDHATLSDALAGRPRPPGRLRIEVDPVRF
jgi:primosomal protein N' (replication factor Y)